MTNAWTEAGGEGGMEGWREGGSAKAMWCNTKAMWCNVTGNGHFGVSPFCIFERGNDRNVH